jgi:two-component system phosphate regulon sensor histidine kinase PhoR
VSKRLHWRIALPYVSLILIATLGLTIFVSNQVRLVRLADQEAELLGNALLLASSAAPMLRDGTNPRALDELARTWAAAVAGRVTIIDADGNTLGESHEDRNEMENHLLRPEVQQALKTGQGTSRRYSTTLGYEMMYAAVLIRTGGGQLLGVMRVALPMWEIEAHIAHLRQTIVLAGLLVALIAALLAVFIAERTTQPLRQLTAAAERMAKGEINTDLVPFSRDEVGQLTRAVTNLASQIREQMACLAAVLDRVTDGVLITDGNGRVRLVNAAAARFIDVTEERVQGRLFSEIVSFQFIAGLWKMCGEQGEQQLETVKIGRDGLYLQVTVSPLPGGLAEGCLVILQNVTRVRYLETAHRNLFSNIGHELRTLLASLKAVMDTLIDGVKDVPAAKGFLERMDIDMSALAHIAEELLELSSIESGQASLLLEPTPVVEVVKPPVDHLRPKAQNAGLELTLLLPAELPQVLADANRTQLVISNLLQNAIKFTPPGGYIHVDVQAFHDEVLFSVQDSGVGIPAEDLPLIFESPFLGEGAQGDGIGLGLAIAKKIVQGHGGRIWAESSEGQGSAFHFTLCVAIAR